ncbi:MAG: hypothetical protein HPY74_08540 [Firmicutes bacterium]|nr:hypothetical protein [Bacillota bacterium]
MKGHYEVILNEVEANLEPLLANLVSDKNSFDYGGFINYIDNMVHPGSATGSLLTLIPLYLNKDSRFYREERLYNTIITVLDYIKRVQRPDGTFDLLTTNFYSSPDAGFITQSLANAYKLAEKYNFNERSERIRSELYGIIKKCGYGMVGGGFHTPNHRWVIAAALMMAYNITGEKPFEEMAKRYLNEGIDCDEYGEYTERSTGIYNAINDNALIILSEEMKREDLLEHVKRNLDMMFTYIEPDGSIFTQNSTRQDKGEGSTAQVFYPTPYYHLYLYMAYKFKDGKYAAMADYIFKNSIKWSKGVPNVLYLYMLKEELKEFEIEKLPIPENYHKYYEKSGIVRVRKGSTSYTILKDSSNFLFFQKGSLKCYMKMCASFFAKAQFKAQEILKTSDGYKLSFKTQGYYRMPFEEAPPTSDWRKMDHNKRQLVNILDLVFNVYIAEDENGLNIHVVTDGCDRVPVKLELCFSSYSMVQGESFAVMGEPGQSIVVKSGYVQVRKGADIITVGPGFGKHTYTTDMRGSEPQSKSDYTIYFTDYTNFDRRICIK